MKENSFNELLSKIDSDPCMDQRISEQLLNYDETSDKTNIDNHKRHSYLLNKLALHPVYKIAVAVLVLVIIGTTTVVATGQIKTYLLERNFISEEEYKALGDYPSIEPIIKKNFGEGHKIETRIEYDGDGNIVSYEGPEDPLDEDVKAGDEVFAEIGLPNLIPTYLYDHYLLYDGGFGYEKYQWDGETSNHIFAHFITANGGKSIYVQFYSSNESRKGKKSTHISDLTDKDYDISTYINQGGLTCNIFEDKKNNNILVDILFDSLEYKNGSFFFCFCSMKMEDVKEILDTIPLNTYGD